VPKSRVDEAIQAAIAHAKTRTERRKRFTRKLSKLGGPRPGQRSALKLVRSLGIDVGELAAEAAKRRETLASQLARMGDGRNLKKPRPRKLPPSLYTTIPSPGDATPTFPLCLFPAQDCSYSTPNPALPHSCNPGKAEMNLSFHSHEVGGLLGILATPWVPPVSGSLWYGVIPPIGGTLAVIAQVIVSGYMYVRAESYSPIINLLPSLKADALARLVVRTHQVGGTGTQATSQVIGETHCGGGETDGHTWVEDLFVSVLYSQVLPDLPVAIEVSVELEGQGRSTFGYSDIGLEGSGSLPGVRVAALCLNLTPAIIL